MENNMNILLVYPEMPDTFYAMKHFIFTIGKKAAYPPLGLLTVASLLPKEWNLKLIDLNTAKLTDEDLKHSDLVFISAMNVQEGSVRDIVLKCKDAGRKIVAGGPLFTHEYERFPEIDHFVLNEAEITLPGFLNDLEKGTLKQIYRTNEFAEITNSPLPSYELVNMKDYMYSIVQFSRGCPHKCDFCDVTALFGRVPRVKTSAQMIAELEVIHKQKNIQMVLFADDNLIGNKKMLKNDLLPALIEWRKRMRPTFFFATQLTVDLIDDKELIKLMIDAGFRHIFVGIETPSSESLSGSSKNQNLKRDLLNDVLELHRAGFIVAGGFIVGFDSDESDIFKRQAEFIQRSGIPLAIVNILKAPPGTELFERMKSEGRLTKDFAFLEGDTNIIPVMDEAVLYQGYLDLTEEIYAPEKSYERIVKFFETYKIPETAVKVPEKFGISEIVMAARIFFLMGVVSRNRLLFWKLIFWALKHERRFIDKAVLFAIMIEQMDRTHKYIRKDIAIKRGNRA
jgi:radical SAM superfamily enzyme YgiQ (UPF0313 family)